MFDKYSKQDLDLLRELYPDTFKEQLEKLKQNYPIQYLIGYVNFYGNKILVNENVLIPRFETEYLVNDTISLINKYIKEPKIIDICTGSGCIAISLAKEFKVSVDALDISSDAILLAKESANLNEVDINFINQDIKEFNTNKKYNVLISNPPYIEEGEYVSKETKYEPSIALYANDNGLEYYKIILEKSLSFLDNNNIISFEIGSDQSNDIIKLIKDYYPKARIIAKNDLNNLNRYVYIINE